MKNKLFYLLLLVGTIGLSISSCTSKNQQEILAGLGPCDTTATQFAGTILPILDQHCNSAGCHNATSQAGNYDLSTYAGVKAATLGPKFLGSINHKPGFSPMPKTGGKLDDCEIQKIEIWVRKGAQNN